MTVADTLRDTGLKGPLDDALVSREVTGLAFDSRRVQPGNLFFAFLGDRVDGRRFAPQALEKGALAVVCETPRPDYAPGPWIEVRHGRRALALAARNTYRKALDQVSITGITGTNGKTTTAYLADSIERAGGETTALIGTIEYLLAGRPRRAINTTPESLDLYRIFDELAQLGGGSVTMEVSSHALEQGRVHGVPFETAVFTNLSRDHLDYHETMENYFAAKQLLFTGDPPPRQAVLNRDDGWCARLETAAETSVLWYGFDQRADLRATNVRVDFDGVHFTAVWAGRQWEVHTRLLGRINVYNILAAIGVGIGRGYAPERILAGIAACEAVPGRFERIEEGQPFLVVVDYAHTDDALRNVIAAARELSPKRVITLFGCGGDRDRAKRPLMGQAAGEGSDYVVLTSDNPRTEDPLAIMNDALVGLRRQDVPHKVEPDRETAIQLVLSEANTGDIVIIAGKGHETYQVIGESRILFDDREVARRVLRGYGYERGVA